MTVKLIVPAITFITTYYEGIQGIFGFVPNYIERPFQAFAGGFLGSLGVGIVGSTSITKEFLKSCAIVGATAAVGSLIGGVVGGLLGFPNVPMAAAVGAAAGAYMAY